MSSHEKKRESAFHDLVARVQACRKCPRMTGSARVLGPGCGPLDAPLMFIGEAPGRLGADGSQLPFHGDKSGRNFESLIDQVGINRYQTFVTNAVLCNPKDERGNNATPTLQEVSNCAGFLREQIELVAPAVVVTLGTTALRGCAAIEEHGLTLRDSVRTATRWMGRMLVPVYHPGQRAMIHRSFSNQLSDYQFVSEIVRRGNAGRRRPTTRSNARSRTMIGSVAKQLITQRQGLSYFALHKLFFLAEVKHLEETGERLTQAYIIRQKDGPYCVELHISGLREIVPGIQIQHKASKLVLNIDCQPSFLEPQTEGVFDSYSVNVVEQVVKRYGSMSDAELKRVTYLSRPMRALLRKERNLRVNLFNAPVLPAA